MVVEKSQAAHSPGIRRVLVKRIPRACAWLCLSTFLIGTSCVPRFTACFEGQPVCTESDWIVTKTKQNKPRFEFVEEGLTPSKNFWLKKDEPLRFKWDDFIYLLHAPDKTCDFDAPTVNTDNCQRCKWCNQDSECNAQIVPDSASVAPALVFLDLNSTSVIQSLQISPGAGCGDGTPFTPPKNCTVQLKDTGAAETPFLEAQAFVLENAQTVTYELKELDQSFDNRSMDAGHNPVKFYSGTVPPFMLPDGPGLEDNFSTHLHITKVRILKVTKQILPIKARTIMDAIPVLPSRLVLIPGYQAGASIFTTGADGNFCYVDASKADGDFDLSRCRLAIGAQGTFLSATPAFLTPATQATPGMPATAAPLLTWVAEFRESEGAIQPTIDPATESLAIEFTIEPH